MKKIFAFSLIFVFQFGLSQDIKEKSLLWEISGKGLSQPSYLFGTVHIACQGEVEMRPELQNAFDKTEQLILELDMDEPSLMTKMMQASLATDGKKVSEKLGDELSAKVDSLITAKMGMSLAMFENLNLPTISVQLGMLAIDCPMDLGYDMMLLSEAQALKREVKGLETPEAQIDVLFAMTNEDAMQSISYLVNNFDEAEQQLRELLEYYRNQDVQALYNFTKESFEDPKYPQGNLEDFLDKRNENWIPVIEKEIKTTPSLIAVGAAHLAGEKGVINLLRKQGYKVKAVL
ncbi:TraB/GumN family protein [Moheibacter sp.]|uniref:TraB/GumN family protein n=1 Tax=Moheibacter sp. TaxID=1965316 RepID=UPI003C731BB5